MLRMTLLRKTHEFPVVFVDIDAIQQRVEECWVQMPLWHKAEIIIPPASHSLSQGIIGNTTTNAAGTSTNVLHHPNPLSAPEQHPRSQKT